MEDAGAWFRLVLAILACWRITHLLAREDGPGDLLVRLRRRLGDRLAGRFLDCFYCLSVWTAVPFAFYVRAGFLDRLVTWVAISGGTCLLEKYNREPASILGLPETGQGGEGKPWDVADRSETR